jgi:hypothetical protein
MSLVGYQGAPVEHICRGDDIIGSAIVLDNASVFVEHGLE